ncbi:hypothetical protein niasHS_004974 [Heterodera schachtii]|uniref:Uncharacterized protein n=1 Tax=Heterodera schachtii TaxID=97005 RepID=A0ABD2JQU1_HETSC
MHFGTMQLLLVLFSSFDVCNGMRRRTGPSDKASSSNSSTTLITPTLPDQLEPVKIRVSYANVQKVPGHVYVVIGDYEYDMDMTGSGRRKFRFAIDAKLEASNKEKAQLFKGDGLFVAPAKAEKVFFEMAERFWFKSSYDHDQANSLDYIFNFVNALFDGKGPKKEVFMDLKKGGLFLRSTACQLFYQKYQFSKQICKKIVN